MAIAGGNSDLPLPRIDASRQGALVTYDKDGKERWRARWTVNRLVVDGQQPMVRLTEEGAGKYSPFRQEVRWNLESYWWLTDRFFPQHSKKTFTDLKGNVLVVERTSFEWEKGMAKFERVDKIGNRSVHRKMRVPADTLTPEGLGVALRSLPFDSRRPVRLHILADEPKVYEVVFRVDGVESVKTARSLYDCYRVKMDVKLGIFSLFKVFLPDVYFWFTQESPHFWVRYQGPERGRGSPEVVRVSTR